ncbi:hypothetical protein [Bacillus thuringiensis]|uniref:hypothetical protein n=1 Tax=Bacillus thuringiensis TaxID=1428 RepID=UPI0014830792|nr:hypothetical protein [Bacillus thuringiensis]MED3275342.1 hypothetical protein [Bacillus thuringiensis]
MKLRKNKSIVIPSIFACCSFMIAAPSPAAMDKYNFRWDMPIMPAWMEHTIPDGTSIHS